MKRALLLFALVCVGARTNISGTEILPIKHDMVIVIGIARLLF